MMNLGTFSVSLNVKDIKISREFYEKLGFTKLLGDEVHWLILKNDSAIIGLFQGMFDHNIMTFNPLDVRSIQKELRAKGVTFVLEADETSQGPAHLVINDPDGNAIMLDQH